MLQFVFLAFSSFIHTFELPGKGGEGATVDKLTHDKHHKSAYSTDYSRKVCFFFCIRLSLLPMVSTVA